MGVEFGTALLYITKVRSQRLVHGQGLEVYGLGFWVWGLWFVV